MHEQWKKLSFLLREGAHPATFGPHGSAVGATSIPDGANTVISFAEYTTKSGRRFVVRAIHDNRGTCLSWNVYVPLVPGDPDEWTLENIAGYLLSGPPQR